jgi:hypothetical protein
VSRERWLRQDLAMRLLQVREDTEGSAARGLSDLAESLAQQQPLETVREGYAALADEYVLPSVDELWAVGYPIGPRAGGSQRQLEDGLQSATPLTMQLLAGAGIDPVAGFAEADPMTRQPIGARFAQWLSQHHAAAPAELAAFEYAVQSARRDGYASHLGTLGSRFQLATGFTVLACGRDVVALAERVADGGQQPSSADAERDPVAGKDEPCGVIVGRDGEGQLLIVAIGYDTAMALRAGNLDALSDAERASLKDLGVLVPTCWPLTS